MPETRRGAVLFPILLVNFIGTLGFSIVLPFLVVLVERFGGGALVYGLMGATYSVFQLVGAPVLGRWSDRFGRRRILLLSQLGTLVSWCVFLGALFVPNRELFTAEWAALGAVTLSLPLAILFVARALDGVTGGNVSVANAYLADVTAPQDRKTNFGKMAVAGNLGFILGPTLAGLLGATRFGELPPVLAALAISAVASAVIALYLPESRPTETEAIPAVSGASKVFGQEPEDCFSRERKKGTSFQAVMRREGIPALLVLYFVIFLAFNVFYTAFPVHAVRGLGWTITEIGLFFSFLGLTTVLVQGPLLSRLGPKTTERALTVVGAAILGSAFAILTFARGEMLYVAAALFSLGNGLMWPSFLAALANAAGESLQGAVQGYGSSVGSLASIVGLVVGGVLYDALGAPTFLVSAVLTFVVLVLAARWVGAQSRSRSARST